MELVEVVNVEEWCNYKDLIEEKCQELVESFEETIFIIVMVKLVPFINMQL